MDSLVEKYIAVDPQIQHGKPYFRRTRIPVYLVLELLESGVTAQQITGQDYYPDLTQDHIRAALRFAAEYAKNQEFFPFGSAS